MMSNRQTTEETAWLYQETRKVLWAHKTHYTVLSHMILFKSVLEDNYSHRCTQM